MSELETAKLACIKAGEIAMRHFRNGVGAKYKAERSIVTEADVKAEKKIKEIIAAEYPSHGFLGEEEGSHGDQKNLWIIDPIDGTTNFFHGVEQFAVSIACMKNGRHVCGCVYNPPLKRMYYAQAGKGAWLNREKIRVSRTAKIEESLLISGFPYEQSGMLEKTFKSMQALRGKCHDIRRFGSASMDMCYVAEGICDAFFEYTLNSWDVAAAMLIVREAGGRVTDINGNEATVDSGHFLASNGLIHDEMLAKLERV